MMVADKETLDKLTENAKAGLRRDLAASFLAARLASGERSARRAAIDSVRDADDLIEALSEVR